MITAGNGIYERCPDCGKLVKLNKFLFGSLHICSAQATGDCYFDSLCDECDQPSERLVVVKCRDLLTMDGTIQCDGPERWCPDCLRANKQELRDMRNKTGCYAEAPK